MLKKINESTDQLMQALSDELGKDKFVSNTFKGKFNDGFFNKCYSILNKHFFSSKLDKIPIYYKSDVDIRKFLIARNTEPLKIPKIFYGTHSVILENDTNTLKWEDILDLHDDVILLNADHIENKSLVFAIACLCHEMIHYYDRLFGEYCDFTKYEYIANISKNIHNTLTFENMKDKANELGINVIQDIPNGKNSEILDKEAIELLFKKAKEQGLIIEKDSNTTIASNRISIMPDGRAVINTF